MKPGMLLPLWGALLLASSAALAAPSDITIPGDHVFPESITSSADGTLYIGSIGQGMIYRVPPGGTAPETFVAPGSGQMSIFGVLADDKSGTLYACTNDTSMMGVVTPGGKGPPGLRAYDLKSGALKGSYPFPGNNGFCNDIAVGSDGAAYVTDSLNPRVLRLKSGASALEIWVDNPIFGTKGFNLDGIAFGADGNMIVTSFSGNKLYRVEVAKDMAAGNVTELTLSKSVVMPDGLRPEEGGMAGPLLLIEGGNLDRIAVKGNDVTIDVLRSGLPGAVAVAQIGKVAYVAVGQLNFIFDPSMKGKTPEPSKVYATPLSGN